MINPFDMKILQIQKKLFLLSIILGLDLLSYMVQPYIPPSDKHSLSYTVENCPSHRNRNPISQLALIFIKSDMDEGGQKHCFCYTCNCGRVSFLFVNPSLNLSIDDYLTCLLPLEIKPSSKDLTGCIAVRSPPIYLS